MELTSQNVHDVIMDCLFTSEEAKNDEMNKTAVIAEGIMTTMGFHPERLARRREDIGSMLDQLPDPFKVDRGGGWSFLNACDRADGVQWTDFHQTMDHLFLLGIATKQAKWLSSFPGGMPYVVVGDIENSPEIPEELQVLMAGIAREKVTAHSA